jgi:hypothetical protein
MASPVIDITMFGDKALERKLAKLPPVVQRKVVRKECRESAKRMKPRVVAAVPSKRGKLKQLVQNFRVRAGKQKRGSVYIGLTLPEERKDAIAIFAVEYGSKDGKRAAQPFIRRTVNAHMEAEQRRIGQGIGRGIEKHWRAIK